MLTRRETQQIVNWVLREIQKRNYPLSTDNKIDLSLATTGKIRGGTIRGLGVGASAYVADISFTPVDYDTITWSPGNISLLDGRNQTVASGYATISGTTYLYCDWGDDEVKTTTTYSGALGYNRVFVGVASSSDDTVSGMAYVANPYSSNILITTDKVMDNLVTELKLAGGAVTADKIAANAVTSQKIYAGEIDALKVQAAQIYALSLSAISANLGTITAGDIYGVTISGSTIYAGEGDVVLNVSGIQIYGEMLDFYDDTVSPSQQGAIWGYDSGLAVCGKTELYLCLGEAMADVAYMYLDELGVLIVATDANIELNTTDTLKLTGYDAVQVYSQDEILIYAATSDTLHGGITISNDPLDTAIDDDDINIVAKVDFKLTSTNATINGLGDLWVLSDIDCDGVKNCAMKVDEDRKLLFAAIESPNVWFEDKLSGETNNKICRIDLDQRLVDNIDTSYLNIIVTPTSDCGKIWVEKGSTYVIVHSEIDGSFDISISARRRGYSDISYDEKILDKDVNKWYRKSKESMWLAEKAKLRAKPVKQLDMLNREDKRRGINKK